MLCGLRRQVSEIVEEMQELRNESDENRPENYDSIEKQLDQINVKNIQQKVVEEISESLPAPGEPLFTVSLIEQDVTPDNELTNPMYVSTDNVLICVLFIISKRESKLLKFCLNCLNFL